MADEPYIDWVGESGTSYRYWIYPINKSFGAQPANYIYTRETKPKNHRPIYMGETGDLSDRTLDTHHKENCIAQNGATHIHVHKSSTDDQIRRNEENDLVRHWSPVCND